MDGQQNLEAIMGLIMYGGNAKSDAMEAIAAAKSGDFELADKKIADAEESLVHAHHLKRLLVRNSVLLFCPSISLIHQLHALTWRTMA